MYNINEEDKKLLEEALAKFGIKAPEQYNFDKEGFMTWGNINRLWAKKLGDFFIFGDFDTTRSINRIRR